MRELLLGHEPEVEDLPPGEHEHGDGDGTGQPVTVGGSPLDDVLASIETMAAQRPIAAQIVALTEGSDAGARDVARLLAADPALSGRVLKLANSAYYGMRGRVGSLQFAIAVVGFSVVRSMATVALTDTRDESQLPEDYWTVSTHLALAASALAPRLGSRPQDAVCVGLLAQLGVALLHHHDRAGYDAVREAGPTPAARRVAETQRYGTDALGLTALAMRSWAFPGALVDPVSQVDDLASAPGGLLRGALEITGRLTRDGHQVERIERLTGGRVSEVDLRPMLTQVRTDAAELRRTLLG
ncbi:HDOD domain-containing protein [Modestobacter sp. Leaf380]|uniref:HDOD domain-containing protein n=1 Tax=Modestobacter sp. Leaf380 TaxID=1736356 RepID=UPI001F2D0C8D|nr:HDOD domain-containing protein [Modestobacter sp. Leaf380]